MIPDHHDSEGQEHAAHEPDHRDHLKQRQHEGQKKAGHHGDGEPGHDQLVILKNHEIDHLHPHNSHHRRDPETHERIGQGHSCVQHKKTVQRNGNQQLDAAVSIKGGHDLRIAFLKQTV